MVATRVTQIWRYPVKSFGGERLDAIEIGETIPYDRTWGVMDADSGQLLSAKTVPELLMGSARMDNERCVLSLPGGIELTDDDAEVDAWLSEWLDRPVRLARPDAGVRATIAIEYDEGQDDPGELPVYEFETQPGWFHDSSSSLHIISTGTLDHIEAEVGPGAGAVERYRPNIVVDLDDPFGEEAWVDTTIAIGAATAWVKKPTDRCVLITRPLPHAEGERGALRYLAAHNDRNAGISAQPRSHGPVRVGDEIGPID